MHSDEWPQVCLLGRNRRQRLRYLRPQITRQHSARGRRTPPRWDAEPRPEGGAAMNAENAEPAWIYSIDDDTWTSSDGDVAIDGVVIRQLARQVLRTRRTR